jgi:hypothetical protein
VRLLHVPFKEAGSLFTAVAKGDVDLTAFSYHSMAGLLAAGRVRPLAVAARQRLRELPDLPTLAEAGAPAVDMHPVGRAGDRGRHAQRRAGALAAGSWPRPCAHRPCAEQAEAAGFQITPSSPQALRQRIDRTQALSTGRWPTALPTRWSMRSCNRH